MKKTLTKIASLAMAFLVLFSTLSFSVDFHYCGEHLVDFSLLEKVDTCVMKAEKTTSETQCSVVKMEMDCCEDVQFSQEGQDDLKSSFHHISFDQQYFLTSYFYSYVNLFEGLDENIVPFIDYTPPPLIRDIQILDQTFLI